MEPVTLSLSITRWEPVPRQMYPLIRQLNPEMTYARFCELLEAMRAKEYFILAAFDHMHLAGIVGCWLGTKFWCGHYLEMDNVVVDEAYRNQGIGHHLMQAVIQEAKALGCDAITLSAYIDNEGAHRFYDRYEFQTPGTHRILYVKDNHHA